MPRRSILSALDRDKLVALPEDDDELIERYAFTELDDSLIRQRRGDANRLGFAVQLCLLRYPGFPLGTDMPVSVPLFHWVARQLQVDAASWVDYGLRADTRRDHLRELRSYLNLSPFGLSDFRSVVHDLTELGLQTDTGLVLARRALEIVRERHVILPAVTVIDRMCAIAVTRANRQIHRTLVSKLTEQHRQRLDGLLELKPESDITWMVWLRQSPQRPNSRFVNEHIDRLKALIAVGLPDGIGRHIHQNRLLKMAREGGRMTPKDLRRFEDERRYATLVAVIIECMATVTDELIELHDRIMVRIFSVAKNKHQEQFHQQGKSINDKVRLYSQIGQALLSAKKAGSDPMQPSSLSFPGMISPTASPRRRSWPSPSPSTICTSLVTNSACCVAILQHSWTSFHCVRLRPRKACSMPSSCCAP